MKVTTRYGMLLASIMTAFMIVSAAIIREKPSATSNGSTITVRWFTLDENGVQKFEVLRSAGDNVPFIVIGSLDPKGSNSQYEFVDRSVFKGESGWYIYKIRIINGTTPAPESDPTSVSHLSSAAKRTWGSIKAMFR